MFIKLEATEVTRIGFSNKIFFYDINNNRLQASFKNIIAHNLNVRISEDNLESLFIDSSSYEPPYYEVKNNEISFVIIEVPKNTSKISIKNWGNTTYGKSYFIKLAKTNEESEYKTIYTVETNGDGKIYKYDFYNYIYKNNYLIRQKENLYYIDHNYLNLGASTDVNKTNQWLDNYGYDNIQILMESLNYKKTPTDKGFEEIYKSLNIDFKDIKGNISLKNEDKKRNIYYDCEEYKIIDKIRENNGGLGNIVYKKY